MNKKNKCCKTLRLWSCLLCSINAATTNSPCLWFYELNRKRKTDKVVQSIKNGVTVMTECNDNLSEVLAISVQYTNMYILVSQ